MFLKEIKTELVDEDSRLVLKKIITSDGEYRNRKIAVTNSIFHSESEREKYGKDVYTSPFQTHHLRWDKKSKSWDYSSIDKAKQHSKKYGRLFIPYHQKNQEQLENINWSESEGDFFDLADRGMNIIPCYVPLGTNYKELKQRTDDLKSVISKTQKIIYILSSKHPVESFDSIIKEQMKADALIGINCYELTTPTEVVNLSKLRKLNCSFKTGEHSPLIFAFNYPRIFIDHSNVAGSFVYSCFSADVLSEKAHFLENMPPHILEKIKAKSPEEFYLYDSAQRGFNKSLTQKQWYGIDMTRNYMNSVSVNEGLMGHQVIRWQAHYNQQLDLELINDALARKENVVEFIRNYSRWNVFWDRKVAPSFSI